MDVFNKLYFLTIFSSILACLSSDLDIKLASCYIAVGSSICLNIITVMTHKTTPIHKDLALERNIKGLEAN